MNALRRIASLLLMLVVAASLAAAEDVTKMPKPTGYVDDYAGVMTPEGKAQVEAICREVHDKTKAQIFFVTIRSLDGSTIESFANDLFHNWKIGEKKTDRGILVLLAIKEHKRRIEVGYGLEGILPDAKAGDIGRDMVPALKTANYDQAALTGVTEVAQVIAGDSQVTLDAAGTGPTEHYTGAEDVSPPYVPPAPTAFDTAGKWIGRGFTLLFLGFWVFILVIVIRRKRPARLADGSIGWVPVTTGDSSFGSSSDSSSSFSSDSSSSDSGFSGGDGGDSGGGGASGDW